jgi:hypothetical protein
MPLHTSIAQVLACDKRFLAADRISLHVHFSSLGNFRWSQANCLGSVHLPWPKSAIRAQGAAGQPKWPKEILCSERLAGVSSTCSVYRLTFSSKGRFPWNIADRI